MHEGREKISFVIPCYCSEKSIGHVIDEIIGTMRRLYLYDYEIILTDDCSVDCTYQVIKKLAAAHHHITGIMLSKNFGQHAALMAAFRYVTGDIIVCLDDDGQTPADQVYRLLDRIHEGYDVVYASYEHKEHSLFRRAGSTVNDWMATCLLGKPQSLKVTSYFAARRYVIDKITEYGNAYPYVIGLILRTTKSIANVTVNHRKREEGSSGYTFKKLIALWFNGFTAFSVKPLRIATFSGVVCACLGFLYLIFVVINKIWNPDVLMGWSSVMAMILFIGGMLMLMLGIIGEYVGRIYISINRSPQFVVKEIVKKDTYQSIGYKQ